ncbi:hypothetical protein EC844_12810 [Acinetobacter calcoaceticus]|uniref:Uncharacterized protein n=1 Tax=Acinetobacter calcoaceticus TaxID=471 RepID=A0A4R1XFG6_ACICA|nr:hypothetical protein EC844_12810 [Acinetobacter calcoaceticus]
MNDLSAKKINKLLEEFVTAGKKPEKLEIGFKTYARLLEDDQFFEFVTKSEDSKNRLYKGIRIKLITEKHYFKIK